MTDRYIDYSYAPREYPPPLAFNDGLPIKGRRSNRVHPDEVLILTPDRNEKRADFTGAFRPEANKFADLHGVPRDQIHRIDVSKPMKDRAAQSLKLIESYTPRVLAVFCHGYSTGIQIGFRNPKKTKRKRGHFTPSRTDRANFASLISTLSEHDNVCVALYCCSTGDDPDGDADTAPGSGDDSFADLLRDELCKAGSRTCRVFAHVTAGHTTRNPHVKFYDGNYSTDGGVGAEYLAKPGSSSFRALARALKTDFRFRLPFLSVPRVHQLIAEQ
jgi:hypothetical protein